MCVYCRCHADHRSFKLHALQPPRRSQTYEIRSPQLKDLDGSDNLRGRQPAQDPEEAPRRPEEESPRLPLRQRQRRPSLQHHDQGIQVRISRRAEPEKRHFTESVLLELGHGEHARQRRPREGAPGSAEPDQTPAAERAQLCRQREAQVEDNGAPDLRKEVAELRQRDHQRDEDDQQQGVHLRERLRAEESERQSGPQRSEHREQDIGGG